MMPDPRGDPRGHESELENFARLAVTPNRMYIIDMQRAFDFGPAFLGGGATEEAVLTAQFNPTEVDEQLKVDWARMKAHGLSHRPMQYVGTENTEMSFELVFDSRASGRPREDVIRARRFLRSLCFPKKGGTDVRSGQAPRAWFIWPNFLSFQCVITDLSFKHETFDVDGGPTRFTAKVKIEEVRDTRVYSEDVLEGK